jgi:integrase
MAGLYRRGQSKIWWGRAQRENREYRRSLKTTDRAIAERRFRQWLADLDAVAWGEKPRRSFEEASERFVREHLTMLKPRGAERYMVSLKHLAVHFDGKTLDQIKSAEMSAFETARRTQGMSAGTIRRDLACLSSIFTSAIDWEWIDDGSNPVRSYLRRRARRGLQDAPPRTRYLTEAEESRLLDHARSVVIAGITLAIDTGLRRDELYGLRWPQVDLLRGTIATTTRTKSGRARKVPLPERSARILAQLPRSISSDFVLVNPDTGTRYRHLQRAFRATVRRAGLADVRWHDLRRTAGCRWLQRDGKSMEEVSILLGHSSVLVTESHYAFLEGEAVAESLSGRSKTGTGTAHIIPIAKVRQ